MKAWRGTFEIAALAAGLLSPIHFFYRVTDYIKGDKYWQLIEHEVWAVSAFTLFAILYFMHNSLKSKARTDTLQALRVAIGSVERAAVAEVPEDGRKEHTDQPSKNLNAQWIKYRDNIAAQVKTNVTELRRILDEREKDV